MNNYQRKNVTFLFGVVLLCLLFFICGCTEQNRTPLDTDTSKLLGAWVGSMESFSTPSDTDMGSSKMTQLEFTEDTVFVTMMIGERTQTMPQSYSVNGDILVFSNQFSGDHPRGGFPGNSSQRSPLDGDGNWSQGPFGNQSNPGQYPWNGTWPFDGNQTWNGTIQPMNRDGDFGGERSFFGREFQISFNEREDVLYLDGVPFEKVT